MPVIKSIILNWNTYTFSGGTPGPTPHPTGPATIDFLLVGWWGWGWTTCWLWGTWGWGWGWIIHCEWIELQSWTYCVVIWCWWSWLHNSFTLRQWWDSCFGEFVAYGWGWGWNWMECATSARPFNWCNWGSWWWGWGVGNCVSNSPVWWTWCQWCNWWDWWKAGSYSPWWGWGWYSTAGCQWFWDGGALSYCVTWWDWWMWYCSDISWTMEYYSFWGGGGITKSATAIMWWYWCPWIWYCWWWTWWAKWVCSEEVAATSATSYWSWWWGGAWDTCNWWDWCQWVLIVRYPANCNYYIRWWKWYVCWSYKIHRFTSDWELCINI